MMNCRIFAHAFFVVLILSLLAVPGVAQVINYSQQKFTVRVYINPDLLAANAQLDAANARRQHEYAAVKKHKFPDNMILIPGVIDSKINLVEHPEVVAACKMIPAASMDEALALAQHELGSPLDVLIVPHALLTLPVVTTNK